MEVSGQVHTPAALPQKKEPQYPLDKILEGSESQYERYEVEKYLLHLPRIDLLFLGRPPFIPSLYRLSNTGKDSI
jgi:hypothetical protein